MRNGKLNKQEIKTLYSAWEIAEKLEDWKYEHDEYDDVRKYASAVADDMSWLVGALREQEGR